MPGYRLRHLPRPRELRKARGGGLGFYINRGLNVRTLKHPVTHVEVEQMWVSLRINSFNFLIGTGYRPHWVNVDNFLDSLTDSITSLGSFDYTVLLGDFNINLLSNDSKSSRLQQFLQCIDLKNWVREPTHFTETTESLIDLLITDAPVTNIYLVRSPELGGHSMVLAEIKIKKPKIPRRNISFRPLKNIDFTRNLPP